MPLAASFQFLPSPVLISNHTPTFSNLYFHIWGYYWLSKAGSWLIFVSF